jgi:RNA polymerase sigma factor (sigma-70 family)
MRENPAIVPTESSKSKQDDPLPRGLFATTCWTVVLNADPDSHAGREALEALCQTYWFPVYALVRRRGSDPETARDFTQDFFSHLLSHNALEKIRRERGRFRSYLAQSVKNFLADEWDKVRARKRGGGITFLSFDAENAEDHYLEVPAGLTPDRLFDRQWAGQVLAAARLRLEKECEAEGKGAYVKVLDRMGEPEAPTLLQEAERLGMPLNTLKSHLRRARLRHAEIIRELIAETVASPVEVQAELRELMAALTE